ncbi:MAG TPA: carboxypeptidase-like regulatory domain-containing protein [Candidatus Acidoferrales bacterium]|nr:carboxypeptidase-like regulatory domain-containing protein [Candidatus Acidoferrales bacterium]
MHRGNFDTWGIATPAVAERSGCNQNALTKSFGVKGSASFALTIASIFLFVFAMFAIPAGAQSVATGTIVGTVTDNTGAVVVGASVTLIDKATGDTRTTASNDAGHYIFQAVNPSTYTVKFKKSGFSELDVTNAVVQVGTQLTENVQMKLGSVSTTVTVTETAGAELQTMNSTIGSTVSGTALSSLPAVGRDVSTFAVLQPGVTPDGAVAGAVVDQSTFMLDGGQNTNDMDGSMQVYTPSFADDTTGGVTSGNMGSPPPTGVMPTPIDSVEEFKVNTANQTADFNNSAGSQVEVVTKRGTNNWHGTAYEYYLDNNWSANTWDNNLSGTPRPSYHFNRFGAAGGGPIIPKSILGGKTYFFANYEGFRYPQSQTFEMAVPSANMRAGILNFGAGNQNVAIYDPRGIGIDPLVQQLWNTYEPMPNDPSCGNLLGTRCDGVNEQGFKANLLTPERSDFGVARIDHDFGSKWHLMSSYRVYRELRATTSQVDIGGWFPGDTLGVPASLSNRPQQPWYYVAGLTTNISANVTNDFHYSYLRNFWAWESENAPPQLAGTSGALEPFGEQATTVLAPYNVNTQNVRQRFWDGQDNFFRDDVTVLHGNHLFQFGGQYQRNWDYHQRTDNGGGINYTLTYQLGDTAGSGLVDLSSMYGSGFAGGVANESTETDRALAAVMGIVTDSQIAYTRSGSNLALNPPFTPAFDKSTIPYYNVYFGDTWHMKPTFTLTYGLGYTIEMPPTEEEGRQVEVVDASGQLLDVQGYLNQRRKAALNGGVYNPTIGFALVGNTGSGRKYPYNPFYGSFSPRISAAWNPSFQSGGILSKVFGENSSVIRGGYNRIYGRLNGVDLVLVPLLGDGLIQPVQCRQALMSGACGPANPDAADAFRIGVDGATAPLPAASATQPQPIFPGINSVAAGAGEGFDASFRPNVVDSFDLSIQRQFGPKIMVELGYIGRRITHEYLPINLNAVPYMMTLNGQNFAQAYAAVETAMGCATSEAACGAGGVPTVSPQPFFEAALAGTGYCSGFSSCTAAVVSQTNPNAASGKGQFSNFQGQKVWDLWSALDQGGVGGGPGGTTVPGFNFARSMQNSPLPGTAPCPGSPASSGPCGASGQLTSGVGDNASIGWGNYNGAFVSFKTTDWHGLTSQQNFTYSKALGTGAFVQATSEYTADDAFNIAEGYGPQSFDRKFIYNLYVAYAPHVYNGQQGAVGRLLGGWNFAPIFTAGSGAPIICNTQTGGEFTGGSDAQSFGAADGVNYFESANCIFTKPISASSASIHNLGGSPNLFADPGAVYASTRPAILGIDSRAGGEGAIRGLPYWNLDLSVTKDIRMTERFGMQVQANFINILNHDIFFDPVLDYQAASSWGALNAQVNNPRRIQVGVRFNF